MRKVALGEVISPAGRRAGNSAAPVYSLTKHAGFVPSLEYFKKQVFSKETSQYRLVEAGDFAYATIHLDEGSIGIAPEAALISPMYTVFRPDPSKIEGSYLIRFLKSPEALAHYQVLGSGAIHRRQAISLKALSTLPIPLPSLDEQRRIAAILDQADALRAKRRAQLADLDALPQAIFHEMFGMEPARSTVEESSLGRGAIRTGPFGSQLRHSEFVDSGIAVLGLDNVVPNRFEWHERRYITQEKYLKLRRYKVNPGDVLISIMGTTGRCVVAPEDIPTAITTKHICAISPDPQRLDSEFLRGAFLWHPEARHYLARQTKGSIMDGLNMGIIKAMPIPIPEISKQKKYAHLTAHVQQRSEALGEMKTATENLFFSLQSRAFRGEL